jgi:hypothetical protein
MGGYTKLFSDIVESSIWKEPPPVCKVWITMLALSDRDGYIRGSSGWLADKAQVSKEECEIALNKFLNPDATSRTPDHDGRRIEQLEDGWLVLNYLTFRDRLSDDHKAILSRERVRKHREQWNALRNAPSVTSSIPASASASVSDSAKKGGAGGKVKLTDAEFLDHIRKTYTWLCLDTELAKMDTWLLTQGGRRQKTRRFIVNWLNRVEKPLAAQAKKEDRWV